MLKCNFQYQHADFMLNVELEMQQQLLGIVGVSGCGKSTLLKNIVGLLKPTHGSIQFNQQILFETHSALRPMPMQPQRVNKTMWQSPQLWQINKVHSVPLD